MHCDADVRLKRLRLWPETETATHVTTTASGSEARAAVAPRSNITLRPREDGMLVGASGLPGGEGLLSSLAQLARSGLAHEACDAGASGKVSVRLTKAQLQEFGLLASIEEDGSDQHLRFDCPPEVALSILRAAAIVGHLSQHKAWPAWLEHESPESLGDLLQVSARYRVSAVSCHCA